jgi:hypothetical protein
MPLRALTLDEVAGELGRAPKWLRDHWPELSRAHGLPAPIHERGGLVWSAPSFFAWLDRGLDDAERAHAAAYRAALEAARHPPIADDEVEAARERLDARFTNRVGACAGAASKKQIA